MEIEGININSPKFKSINVLQRIRQIEIKINALREEEEHILKTLDTSDKNKKAKLSNRLLEIQEEIQKWEDVKRKYILVYKRDLRHNELIRHTKRN